MSFLLLGMGASATDPMQTQLVEGMNDVTGELQWPSSELDNNINDDGGYAAALAARVELQQVASDHQQEQDNKAKESSKNTTIMVVIGVQQLNQHQNSDGAEGQFPTASFTIGGAKLLLHPPPSD